MRPLRAVARALRIRHLVERLDESLPHGSRTIDYSGFTLIYSRRNSLVERIERQGSYERPTIEAIVHALETSPSRTLLDIGANIGLVSLAVLAALPDAKVYAFEPGPRQHALLAETVRRNGLEHRLELSPLALSNDAGEARFAVHVSRHAAGDGFRDTGRSGRARVITVRTETLDAWWEERGRPSVAAMKLDTEGSELLILRGAVTMLDRCRPVLFLEIQEENLRVYPYDAEEVRKAIQDMGYSLEQLERGEFVAVPS